MMNASALFWLSQSFALSRERLANTAVLGDVHTSSMDTLRKHSQGLTSAACCSPALQMLALHNRVLYLELTESIISERDFLKLT